MRVAAIDCGTNSIRLLIADIDGSNFREVVRDMEIVRLGQGVDQPVNSTQMRSPGPLPPLINSQPRLLSAVLKRFAFVQPAPHAMRLTVTSLSMGFASV